MRPRRAERPRPQHCLETIGEARLWWINNPGADFFHARTKAASKLRNETKYNREWCLNTLGSLIIAREAMIERLADNDSGLAPDQWIELKRHEQRTAGQISALTLQIERKRWE